MMTVFTGAQTEVIGLKCVSLLLSVDKVETTLVQALLLILWIISAIKHRVMKKINQFELESKAMAYVLKLHQHKKDEFCYQKCTI